MSSYSRDSYEIDYYRIPSSNNGRFDHFAPTIQSLKAAQDIVRRYEKRRHAATKLSRRARGAVATPLPALGGAASDNVIPFRAPIWTRPSSRLVYSRHTSAPHRLSPAPRARRASIQAEARRVSRYLRASAPSPLSAMDPAIGAGVQIDPLAGFVVMAVQGMAVILGLSGLLVLLTLL